MEVAALSLHSWAEPKVRWAGGKDRETRLTPTTTTVRRITRYAHSLSLSSSCRNRFASRCSLVALSATLRATLAAGRSWKELGLSGEAWATRQEGHNPFKVLHPIILARGSWFPLATHAGFFKGLSWAWPLRSRPPRSLLATLVTHSAAARSVWDW